MSLPLSPAPTWPQRVVTRVSSLWDARPDRGRRGFLRRAALVGTALAVNPLDFVLRPQSAYASVCGPANECSQGWTTFCCTINGGANTCPDGSYAAGWWKVSSSAFCRGEDRYVIDCNRLPQARCSCRCAGGECDRRRICCNNFRYGQCNQQIPGITEVVCRVVICTPPWEWDDTCTTTVRTDERTREHSASCLHGTDPTQIDIVYQDLGLVGSVLGAPLGEEVAAPDGGSWRRFTNGAIVRSVTFGIAVLSGPAGLVYADADGPNGPLGYVTGDPVDVASGQVVPTATGAIYTSPDGTAVAVQGALDAEYGRRGGPGGWLGFPTAAPMAAPGGRLRLDTESGWSLAEDPSTGEVRLVPIDVELPDTAGQWPPTATVTRWDGPTRIDTAVRISTEAHPDGAVVAVVAAADAFADALSGGVLAAVSGGPVLLTGGQTLADQTAAELQRLGVARVLLVGGTAVLAPAVETDLAAALPAATVQRLAGVSRFDTAAAVSQRLTGEATAPVVYLTSGTDFPDALAASPAAAADSAPLLLTEPDRLPTATRAELARLQPQEVVVVGGPAAVSLAVEEQVADLTGAQRTRLDGTSRYDTAAVVAAALVADADGSQPGGVALVATGEAFADALAAGAAATTVRSPLLLAASTTVPQVTRGVIETLEPSRIVMAGGPAALSDVVAQQLAAIPTGPYTARGEVPTDPDPSPTPTPTATPTATATPEPVEPPTDP